MNLSCTGIEFVEEPEVIEAIEKFGESQIFANVISNSPPLCHF